MIIDRWKKQLFYWFVIAITWEKRDKKKIKTEYFPATSIAKRYDEQLI